MLIANPIYDTVFKRMMKNLDIAKGIISTIIDEEIVTLDFKTRENVIKVPGVDKKELTYRDLDFIAETKLDNGFYKNELIELHNINIPYDVQRFRKYLGEHYQKKDGRQLEKEKRYGRSIPIITIYFLGFNLSPTLPSVIKVNRQYIDVLTGEEVLERSEFIERLIHNSFVIQIPGLHVKLKTRLEYVLSIFQQENFVNGNRHLKSYEHDTKDELMLKILRQLEKAAADNELHHLLELEDMALSEYESTFAELERRLDEQGKELAQKDAALERNARELEQKEKYIKELLAKIEGN
jgi:hypothetical protein